MTPDQLKAHLEYFEELGVDGIRREPAWSARADRGPERSAPQDDDGRTGRSLDRPLEPITVFTSQDAALKAIRDDIGDCTRCKLHSLGRKQIVFGVGNPNADLIVANDVADSAIGFDSDQNEVLVIGRDGFSLKIDRAPKMVIANRILDLVVERLHG